MSDQYLEGHDLFERRGRAEERLRAASGIAALAQNDALNALFEQIEAEVFKVFKNTRIDESDVREQAYIDSRAVKRLRERIERALDDVKLAERELTDIDRAQTH